MTKTPTDEYSSAWKKFSERRVQFSLGAMQSIKSQLEKCKRVLERHHESLINYPNVVGIGISMKYKNGEVLDRPCIVIQVTKKIPNLKEGAIPTEIDGCPTDVLETGEHRPQQALPGPVCPLQPGYSIGHKKITYGTFGGLVREKSGLRISYSPFSDILLLSNNHVFTNNNKAKKGDSIQHPGPSLNQQPLKPSLESALLERWKPLVKLPSVNEIDAAVARPIVPFTPDIKMIGIPGGLRNVNTLNLGDQVQLTGATSGHKTGTVSVLNPPVIKVNYGGQLGTIHFANCFQTTKMSTGGDSGSLLLDMQLQAVGLLFAGSTSPPPAPQTSSFNDLQKVLNEMKVDLVEASTWPYG